MSKATQKYPLLGTKMSLTRKAIKNQKIKNE